MDRQKKGNLYLIPTPLAGNTLDKIETRQLQKVVKNTSLFLVENIRTARRFISSLKLGIEIDKLHFEVLDKNTTSKETGKLCTPLLKGQDIGIMSEAGCPGIADPGNLAVTFAHSNDIRVVPLVGPSSIFMAQMASGFNGQSFVFHGYLPIEKQKRIQAIKIIEKEARSKNQTQIFMETPYRNNQLLSDILKTCQPYTKLCIAKDVSGSNEMIKTKMIKEWRKSVPELHKVPSIFLIL